uniref:Uncharacterized protein n=1 Tax=Labrus bergylta TaxID=56723 RepID=A0A3Q3FF59_9LABR
MKEVIGSHRTYYKLRVCQEAIWEAFRIFFDRVPDSEEYRSWVYTCQHENLCMDDLAKNFSSAQEHLDMVARVSLAPMQPKEKTSPSSPFVHCSNCRAVLSPICNSYYCVCHFQRVAMTAEIEGYVKLCFLNLVFNVRLPCVFAVCLLCSNTP